MRCHRRPNFRLQPFAARYGDLTKVSVTEDELAKNELQPNDVLFNTRNSYELVGKVAIWPTDRPGYVYNNNLLRMRFADAVMPEWAAYQMQSLGFQDRIRRFKSATTSVCALYSRDLMVQPIAVPPIDEQASLVALLNEVMERALELEGIAATFSGSLTQLDQSILSKAFRGELVPQDSADEPASELLARIRTTRAEAEAQKKAAKKRPKKKPARRKAKSDA